MFQLAGGIRQGGALLPDCLRCIWTTNIRVLSRVFCFLVTGITRKGHLRSIATTRPIDHAWLNINDYARKFWINIIVCEIIVEILRLICSVSKFSVPTVLTCCQFSSHHSGHHSGPSSGTATLGHSKNSFDWLTDVETVLSCRWCKLLIKLQRWSNIRYVAACGKVI